MMVPIEGRQLVIFVLWIVLSLIVIGAFTLVILSTRRPRSFDTVQVVGYRLRRGWGIFYGVLLIGTFVATIWSMPYAWAQQNSATANAQTVEVVARQYTFTMPKSLPAGEEIKFVVTSADVNHDFGIYNAQGVLLGQVQAMPDYHNVLYFKFPAPGTYTIRCLEYCGAGHSIMYQTLKVYAPGSASAGARGEA